MRGGKISNKKKKQNTFAKGQKIVKASFKFGTEERRNRCGKKN